ncbi:MAG TPA: hypothetical protein VGT61_05535 [Thermomicrobiales bacterium]|jgi:hydroxypyruvate isomerase|nr:hypothetical protein [Thermomicrobiales bacterium]
MDKTTTRSLFSRRNLLQTATASAVAGAAIAGGQVVGSAAPARMETTVAVAATVVRASHSPAADGTIRLGVRTAIRFGKDLQDGQVLIVDGIDFFADQDEIHTAIIARVRAEVAERLAVAGRPVDVDDITVRVFGGLW